MSERGIMIAVVVALLGAAFFFPYESDDDYYAKHSKKPPAKQTNNSQQENPREVEASRMKPRTLDYYRDQLQRFLNALGGHRPALGVLSYEVEMFRRLPEADHEHDVVVPGVLGIGLDGAQKSRDSL